MTSFKAAFLSAVLALGGPALVPSTAMASDDAAIPDHCVYLYAAATSRFMNAVSGIVTRSDAFDEIGQADQAVQLAINLSCPMEPMVASIDCIIQKIKRIDGIPVGIDNIIECVETNTGQRMPQLTPID